MPIYSRNSIGSGYRVSANENYSYNDMGRILVESAQNDMILFNAVMRNDFKETAAIREGTMVGSELRSFREFSVREAWGNLKEKLRKLWEKIKGVFRQVYAKLGVWFVRNGKMFVAMNRKILANKTGLGPCKIPLFLKQKEDPSKIIERMRAAATREMDTIKTGTDASMSAEEHAKMMLAASLGAGRSDVTTANYSKEMRKYCYDEVKNTTYEKIGVSFEELFHDITGKGPAIKDLKKAEKEIDKTIKEMIRDFDRQAADANKDEAGSGTKYSNASKMCSGFEKAITIGTRSAIACIKAKVGNARQIVGKLVAYTPKKSSLNDSALLEMVAWLEGADDFATMEDIPAEDFNDSDVQEDSDVTVNIDIDSDGEECGSC